MCIRDRALWGYDRHGRPSRTGIPERCLVRIALIPGSFDPVHNGHLEVIERAAIRQTLMQTSGNKIYAAKSLGIAVSTLYEKLKKYGA